MDIEFLYGVLGLGLLGYILAAFAMVQFTFAAVTLYLHRDGRTVASTCTRRCATSSGAGCG